MTPKADMSGDSFILCCTVKFIIEVTILLFKTNFSIIYDTQRKDYSPKIVFRILFETIIDSFPSTKNMHVEVFIVHDEYGYTTFIFHPCKHPH